MQQFVTFNFKCVSQPIHVDFAMINLNISKASFFYNDEGSKQIEAILPLHYPIHVPHLSNCGNLFHPWNVLGHQVLQISVSAKKFKRTFLVLAMVKHLDIYY